MPIQSVLNCITGWGFAFLQYVINSYFLANVFPFFTFKRLCLWTSDSFCHTEVRVCSMLSTGKIIQNLKLVKKEYPLTGDVFLLSASASVNSLPLFVQSYILYLWVLQDSKYQDNASFVIWIWMHLVWTFICSAVRSLTQACSHKCFGPTKEWLERKEIKIYPLII